MNVSQAATLQTPTNGLVSSLPLPSIVTSGLAKFGLLTGAGAATGSSNWFEQLGWFGAGSNARVVGQEQAGWASKQVLGSVLAMIATLLVLEQVSPCISLLTHLRLTNPQRFPTSPSLAPTQVIYRAKKAHLPGPKWTIPIIGKFKDSMDPRLEGYKRQWASGALSVTSVFNM